jgi:hypothetical protein
MIRPQKWARCDNLGCWIDGKLTSARELYDRAAARGLNLSATTAGINELEYLIEQGVTHVEIEDMVMTIEEFQAAQNEILIVFGN